MSEPTDITLPDSIPLRLQQARISFQRIDIQAGTVAVDFIDPTDAQVDAAAAICATFGKTLQRPGLARTAAAQAITRLDVIIAELAGMTSAQRWEAVVDIARIQRSVIKQLLKL